MTRTNSWDGADGDNDRLVVDFSSNTDGVLLGTHNDFYSSYCNAIVRHGGSLYTRSGSNDVLDAQNVESFDATTGSGNDSLTGLDGSDNFNG